MRNKLYSLLLFFAVLSLASCEGDTSFDNSGITYYVTLELNGESFVQVPIGTTYTEEGVTATENGEDVSSKVVISGDKVDPAKPGIYVLTYSAVNQDGFSSSISRTVAVCDPNITTDMSGTYTVVAGSYRLYPNAEGTFDFEGAKWNKTDFEDFKVTVTRRAPGLFYVSDLMGGYYDQRADYGSAYAMYGYLQLLADNTVDCLSGNVDGWSDSFTSMADGKYDPDTKTISYRLGYSSGMYFFIKLELK